MVSCFSLIYMLKPPCNSTWSISKQCHQIYKKCDFIRSPCLKGFYWHLVVKLWHGLMATFIGEILSCQAEEERDGMEKVKLDNRRILFNLLPAHVAQHFLLSNPRNMVSVHDRFTTVACFQVSRWWRRFCLAGPLLPVLRAGGSPLRFHPKLQRFLHRAGRQQHGRGMPEAAEWDHCGLWWGVTEMFIPLYRVPFLFFHSKVWFARSDFTKKSTNVQKSKELKKKVFLKIFCQTFHKET